MNQWLDDMVSDVSAAHEPAGAFGSPPKLALLMPTIVIFAFSGIVLGGVLPRTPALAFIVLYIAFVIGTLVELLAVPVAITRLVRTPQLRTLRNKVITALGVAALAPGLLIYVIRQTILAPGA